MTVKKRKPAKQASRAEHAFRITMGRFDAGGVSQLAVLDAERTRLRAETDRLQAIANRLADTAALYQALGGGWWERQYLTLQP